MSATRDQVTPRTLPEFYPHLANPADRFSLTPLVGSSRANGMSEHLKALLSELERFGETNNQLVADRRRRMLNITRDTGEFLAVLVRAIRARFTLEIGTSNGYSTLWLAEAARTIGGHVTTVEASEFKTQLAARTFARSGLANFITQMHGKAGQMLAESPDESFDVLFLDAERPEYSALWPDLRRVLRPGRLLVVDNATSHRDELAAFVDLVQADPAFTTSLVPVGKGEFLALKAWS